MEKSFAVIFDMDGVIVDSNPVHKSSIKAFCEKYGMKVDNTFLRDRVYGRANSDWVPELFPEASESEIQRLSDEKEALFREMFDPNKHMVKGLLNLVEELDRNQVSMAVATSAPVKNEEYILSALGIRNRFKAILHSSRVERGKPAPDIYEKAAESLNKNPQSCIAFEDSVPGAEAALSAGCYTVGVTTTYEAEQFKQCERTIRDFAGVNITLLKRWIRDVESRQKLET